MSAEEAGGGERGRARFPRATRITASEEIRALFRRGKRSKTRHLDVFVSPSPVGRSRVALVVPKHKRTAVERNRLKRRLRELSRTRLLPGLAAQRRATDVLLRARPEAYRASFAALREEVDGLLETLCSPAR